MIQYVQGDLFNLIPESMAIQFVPHVVNNIGRFGSGFARAVLERFPEVQEAYYDWFSEQTWKNSFVIYYGKLLRAKLESNTNYDLKLTMQSEFELGQIQLVPTPKMCFANMIGQNGVVSLDNPKPIKYLALAQAMKRLADFIAKLQYSCEIHAPAFGSGLAMGDWDFIEELIDEIWLSKKIPVTIYRI